MQPIAQPTSPIYQGTLHKIWCPEGRLITVRETNGNDDAILSTTNQTPKDDAVSTFLADIIQHDSILNKKPTFEDVEQYPINTKYYLVFKQRLINHGPTVEFELPCINTRCQDEEGSRTKTNFVVDAEKDHDNDLNPESDKYITKDLGRNRIARMISPETMQVEFSIASGKKLRFKRMTGVLELKSLELMAGSPQVVPMLQRELEIFTEGNWVLVTNFHGFSSREMGEIKAWLIKYDTQFEPHSECTCPKCKVTQYIPLLSINSFYFPVPKI